jgi:hypothetical protein
MLMVELVGQIQKLRDVYGQHTYPAQVVSALYDEIGHIEKEKLERAVNRILAENVNPRYAPGLKEIEKTLSLMREKSYSKGASKQPKGVSAEKATKALGEIFKNNFGESRNG